MKTFEWQFDKHSFFGLKTDVKNPQFGLIIIHGMGEHISRYDAFLKTLEAHNIYALGIDLRGHGQTAPKDRLGILQNTDTFPAMMNDIHTLYREEKKTYPALKWTLMGHSMGSVIARGYAHEYPNDFDQMIWMGTLPIYSLIMRKGTRLIAGLGALFYRKNARNQFLAWVLNQPLIRAIKAPQTHKDWLSVNPENVRAYLDDPLTGYAYNSVFYRRFFALVDQVSQPANIAKTNLKRLFLVAGKEDPVTQHGASHAMIKSAYQEAHPDLKIHDVQWPNMRHEPLNETHPQVVYDTLIKALLHE